LSRIVPRAFTSTRLSALQRKARALADYGKNFKNPPSHDFPGIKVRAAANTSYLEMKGKDRADSVLKKSYFKF
jgi:hypothetical protein